jgi:hypothetical protein
MLLDHFHPPLNSTRPWTGFHGCWATNLAKALNCVLPDGWFAAPNVHWDIEIDVATFEQIGEKTVLKASGESTWFAQLPAPSCTIEFPQTTDVVETLVYRDLGDLTLTGAIEIISPANKSSPADREAFVAKCDAYLRDGVGVLIVDIVTSRSANLHNELMERFQESELIEGNLYVASYRPFRRPDAQALSIWHQVLRVGGDLPSMPLFLKSGPIVELPLEESYLQTCRDLRIAGPV